MASLRARYLSSDEIDDIVTPLLTESFRPFGYRNKSIKEEEAFDGEPIIRVRANVGQAVPAEVLVKTLSQIHNALEARNEERFVFLSAPGPANTSAADDEDEDEDI